MYTRFRLVPKSPVILIWYQHDGALAHRSRQCTVAYLRSNVTEFIKPEN